MIRLSDSEREVHMAALADWTHDAARDAIWNTPLPHEQCRDAIIDALEATR